FLAAGHSRCSALVVRICLGLLDHAIRRKTWLQPGIHARSFPGSAWERTVREAPPREAEPPAQWVPRQSLGTSSNDSQARTLCTTLPCTSVRRKSRPWNLQVSRLWSTPSKYSMVACRSCTSTTFSTAL